MEFDLVDLGFRIGRSGNSRRICRLEATFSDFLNAGVPPLSKKTGGT